MSAVMIAATTELTSDDLARIWMTFFIVAGVVGGLVVFLIFRAVRGDQRIKEREVELKLKREEVQRLELANIRAEHELRSFVERQLPD